MTGWHAYMFVAIFCCIIKTDIIKKDTISSTLSSGLLNGCSVLIAVVDCFVNKNEMYSLYMYAEWAKPVLF